MASADLRDELTCSICLNIYTDPVTLKCGHNFCQACIGIVFDKQENSGVYSCPDCRTNLQTRPVLQRNTTLCNIAESILSTEPESTDIFCKYCIHLSAPAIKTCLLCEAALCYNHLKVHSKTAEHVLTEPTHSFGNRKCCVHNEILKYYCSEDATCVCVSCSLVGQHRGHQLETLNHASKKKKGKMRSILKKMTSERDEAENRVLDLQNSGRDVQGKAADIRKRVTALIEELQERLENLEKQVLEAINKQEERILLQVSDITHQLEIRKEKLSRKMGHIEELCNMTDPLTVLQETKSDSTDFCDTEGAVSMRDIKSHSIFYLDKGKISAQLEKGLADIMNSVTRQLNNKLSIEIQLDVNTAGNNVVISHDLKTASSTSIDQCRPQTPERFNYCQVLSTRSFSSGQHCWEVDTSKSEFWRIGMAYSSIERKEDESYIGYNKKSWCLRRWGKAYSVIHDSKVKQIFQTVNCQRYRVCLDYMAGKLSFYVLCDPIRHLHTFNATFTEPLHVAWFVWEGSLRIRN
ncbi:E3 ubiquitin/ISG15 ligase TRIM25-like [Pelodytes ibericus]